MRVGYVASPRSCRLLLSIAIGSAVATVTSAVTCGRDDTRLSALRAAAAPFAWGIQIRAAWSAARSQVGENTV